MIPHSSLVADVVGTNASVLTLVLAQSGGAQLLGGVWLGALATLGMHVGYLYKVDAHVATTVTVHGIIPSHVTYALNTGWTWIGVPLTGYTRLVDNFLPDTWETGDRILAQDGGTQYFGGSVGWIGSLVVLRPGVGYKVRRGKGGTFNHSTDVST